MEIHMKALMLMLLLLTQNHHVKTDAHSSPSLRNGNMKLSSYQKANPKLHSLSQCTYPFFSSL